MTPAQESGESSASIALSGEDSAWFEAPSWRSAAASVTGASHIRRGGGCEDAVAAGCRGEWLAAVVCDGAGSAPRGAAGAGKAAAAIVEGLLGALPDGESGPAAWRATILETLRQARQGIAELAAAEDRKLAAFSTTVVGALAYRGAALLFHIGDGVASAFGPADEVRALSLGRPKEYANETYFLTDETWEESLLFEEATDVECILLATDGIAPFLVNAAELKPSFFEPVLRYLRREGVSKGAPAMQRLMAREDLRKMVADDKTLLWAQRSEMPREAEVGAVESAELAR